MVGNITFKVFATIRRIKKASYYCSDAFFVLEFSTLRKKFTFYYYKYNAFCKWLLAICRD